MHSLPPHLGTLPFNTDGCGKSSLLSTTLPHGHFVQDPLVQYRNVLPVTYGFGTARCWSGYEGIVSDDDRFLTCHYNIFEPNWLQRNSIPLIVG